MIKDFIDAQKEIKESISRSYRNNRLSHAYIFNGKKGVGKKEMALYFAARLYCKEPEVCFKCENCHQIFSGEHPNVYFVKRRGNSITKEQVENLQKEFSKTSLVEGPRVYIIEDADKMNITSSNRLLKFVEEPEEGIHAIFLTTDLGSMLPTIISRCCLVNFKEMDKEKLLDILIEKGLNQDDAEVTRELTNNAEEAMSLSVDESFHMIKTIMEEFFKIRAFSDTVIFKKNNLDDLSDAKNFRLFLDMIVLGYEDMLGKASHFRYLSDCLNEFKEIRGQEKIEADLESILKLRKMADSNMSARLLALDLFTYIF